MVRPKLVLWFGSLLALSLLSRWQLLGANAERCDLDGTRIEPIYRVDLLRADTPLASFCSIPCAREWPDTPADATWHVRDEVTGERIDATRATFVRSSVVTVPSRAARIHAFGTWVDAMEHMTEFDGEHVQNPFAPSPSLPDVHD